MNPPPDPPQTTRTAALDASAPGGASAPAEICPRCRQAIRRRGLKGECLRCLIALALPPDEATPAGSGASDEAGETFHYGHFEVAVGQDGFPVELGSGGMATTYRAHDTVLHSPVALKVINDHILGHASARTRFLREARAAAKLQHPNVANVTFYGEQDGECYYAMELVEGETLEAKVRREGPLAPGFVLEVGVQVAQALAAAEACGLVHRDLKPSNIMLAARPEAVGGRAVFVKVIDWGLAKAVSAEPTPGVEETWHGFVGTPAFASPEQFERGADERIDMRSDIYSLGVTLWFLLCGRTPFVGETLAATRAQRIHPPFEQLTAARVPRGLVEILRRALDPDPARRPQSAHELFRALRDCQTAYDRQAGQPARRWRWLAMGGLLTAGAVLAAAVATRQRAEPRPAVVSAEPSAQPSVTPIRLPARSVAVLPFENLSADQADAFFALGMQEEISAGLAQAAQLKVINPGSTRAYEPGKVRDYPGISRDLGAQNLLEGSVRRAAGRVRIVVRLVDGGQPGEAWEHAGEGSVQEVFALQSEILHAVINRLQTPLSTPEAGRIDQPLTADPEAHDLYLRAVTMRIGVAHADEARMELEAVALLDAAVARDPHFAAAYRQLAGAHNWLYQARTILPPPERAVDHRRLADLALDKARQLDPDSGDLHLAAAESLLRGSDDYARAQAEIDLARKTLPNDATLELLAGEIAYSQGHWQDGLRAEERAVSLDPMDWATRLDMAHNYRHLRYYDKCDRELARVVATVPAENMGHHKLIRALLAVESRADLAPLRTTLAAFTATDDPTGRSQFRNGFLLHLYERDTDAAARTLATYPADPVRSGTHLYPRAWFEAQVAQMRGDAAGTRVAFTAVREAMARQVATDPKEGWPLSMLAVADAALGHREDALREARHAVGLEPFERHQSCAAALRGNLALVYAWIGQTDDALDVLEALADKPSSYDIPAQASYGDLRLNPCWDRLRGNPRFEAIIPRFTEPVVQAASSTPRPPECK